MTKKTKKTKTTKRFHAADLAETVRLHMEKMPDYCECGMCLDEMDEQSAMEGYDDGWTK